jgi:cytochrome b
MSDRVFFPKRIYLKVWDPIVRIGHWAMVLCFASLYFPSDKFPLHTYAAYIIMAYMIFRIVWGFIGPRSVRFTTFLKGPSETIRYGRDSLVGQTRHTISHNPLGGWMILWLIISMLLTGALGVMVYSAGQELGPLGNSVPAAWEGEIFLLSVFQYSVPVGLKDLHHWSGNLAASLVTLHVIGNLWTTALHRSQPIVGMITGVKDAEQDDPERHYYREVPAPRLAGALSRSVGPAISEVILIIVILTCLVWPLVELLTWLNQFMPAF